MNKKTKTVRTLKPPKVCSGITSFQPADTEFPIAFKHLVVRFYDD